MKTQISRTSYDPDKRYSGVYQQQGRMLTDADWNELGDIVKARVEDALRDVIGSGAPEGRGLVVVGSDGAASLQWGHVYVDGIPAQVRPGAGAGANFDYSAQADFPTAPPLRPGAPHRLYVDVWERAITWIEDADLRDPGLHGADTCTRTQTMAQVKWCEAGIDPEIPTIGNAALSLELRGGRSQPDPCDPYADEVTLDNRLGNYLFRVEVHDVTLDVGAKTVTLKWSSENGAEQALVGAEPPGFRGSPWVFEYFSATTEKLLGVHLAPGGGFPTRATLIAGTPTSPPPGLPIVRRWDGSCRLRRAGDGTWSLVDGHDRGVPLSTASGIDKHGHVAVSTEATINLDALTLTLALGDSVFVAGDYWQAPVREAAVAPGEALLTSAAPAGVLHHIMTLVEVAADGAMAPAQGDSCQRSTFPPLTDLHADDVCYDNSACPLPETRTVQDALDQLCKDRNLPWHNRHLHGWGIVCGLQVECCSSKAGRALAAREPTDADDDGACRWVTVRSGYAIDGDGLDIVTKRDHKVNVIDMLEAREDLELEDGEGTVSLTLARGESGEPVFALAPYEVDGGVRGLLGGTIWMDFYRDCIEEPLERLKEELASDDEGGRVLIGPARERLTVLLNLFTQIINFQHGRYVYLSLREHEILESFYNLLRKLIRSATFCGMFRGHSFPAYPDRLEQQTGMSTIFGKGGHTRIRLDPTGRYAYTCGAADTSIHVFDLNKGAMLEASTMPASAGAEVRDVTISRDGALLYAVAVLHETDTIFGVADLEEGQIRWRHEVSVLCDIQLVTLELAPVEDSQAPDLVYAIGRGKGLYAFYPHTFREGNNPRPDPLYAFKAVGPMALDRTSRRRIFAAAWKPRAGNTQRTQPDRYNSIAVLNLDLAGVHEGGEGDESKVPTKVIELVGDTGQQLSGDDDILWAPVTENARSGSCRIFAPVDTGPGKRVLGLSIDREGIVDEDISSYEIDDTPARLAYHAASGQLLVTLEDSCRVQTFDIESNERVIERLPVQLSPLSVAVADGRDEICVLNRLSNTITTIPGAVLKRPESVSDETLAVLTEYRAAMIDSHVYLLGAVIQYLKDCLCHHLLVSCPDDKDVTLYLASVEVRNNKVYKVCNFSHRKYVKSFPTVEYWMSLVPVVPLVTHAVQKACCAILPNLFTNQMDKLRTRREQTPPKKPVIRGKTIRDAESFAKRTDLREEYRGQKRSLLTYRQMAGDGLMARVAQGDVHKRGASKTIGHRLAVADATKLLEKRDVTVEKVEAYDPKDGSARLLDFARTPRHLDPGTRVVLYERDGRVMYYRPIRNAEPELDLELAELERRKKALADTAELEDQLDTLSATKTSAAAEITELKTELQKLKLQREALADMAAMRADIGAMKLEVDSLRVARLAESESLAEIETQRTTIEGQLRMMKADLDKLQVRRDQLSLAINAERPVMAVSGVTERLDSILRNAGLLSVNDLAKADAHVLARKTGLQLREAQALVTSAKARLKPNG